MQQPTAKTDSKQAALDILHKGVSDLMTSDGWKRALEFRQKFRTYSFFNVSLILAQRPDATLVAGYRRWQEAGRFVRKGEKGIAILAPVLRQDPDDADRRVLRGFVKVHIFDVLQTEGEPVPTRPAPRLLEDIPEDRARLASLTYRLIGFCALQGVKVSFDLEHPQVLGVYQPAAKRIAIKPGLSTTQTFKTVCHECAHALMHDASSHPITAELEAETTAFLVSSELGIDTSSYSFAYLGHYTASLEALIQAGERASKAADIILNTLTSNPDEQVADHQAAA